MAVVTFDSKKLFDTSDFSDIIIRTSDQEFKLHKIILCNNSEYFNLLCGLKSKFLESTEAVIELKDDDPKGAEAVLRHLYGFEYPEILDTVCHSGTGLYNAVSAYMSIIVASKKYMAPKLKHSAVNGFSYVIKFIGTAAPGEFNEEITDVLDAIELLVNYKEHRSEFAKWTKLLINYHLPVLFRLKRFRNLIETEPWKEALEMCQKAVQNGHPTSYGKKAPKHPALK